MELTKEQFDENVRYLEENGIEVTRCGNEGQVELCNYTDAGGEMFIELDSLDRQTAMAYIADFDINREVLQWWRKDGTPIGLPFDNLRDHYDDTDKWHSDMIDVFDRMPY